MSLFSRFVSVAVCFACLHGKFSCIYFYSATLASLQNIGKKRRRFNKLDMYAWLPRPWPIGCGIPRPAITEIN